MLTVNNTNDEGVTHVETFRTSNWRALAVLCGAESGPDPVDPVGRNKVLINDVQAAVDRYRSAGEEATDEAP